jgi:hypothetical protein
MSSGRFLVQPLPPHTVMPSPHAEDQHRRKRQGAAETELALCPVHIGHDGLDLVGEEVGQTEPQRGDEYGDTCVRHDELPGLSYTII